MQRLLAYAAMLLLQLRVASQMCWQASGHSPVHSSPRPHQWLPRHGLQTGMQHPMQRSRQLLLLLLLLWLLQLLLLLLLLHRLHQLPRHRSNSAPKCQGRRPQRPLWIARLSTA